MQFSKPAEASQVSGIISKALLKAAFDIMPDTSLKYSYLNEKGMEVVEQWIAYTDAYNNKYLYCKETESSAYYVNDGSMFYFTAFYGNKKSLLYYFYLSVYKVFLGNPDSVDVRDAMPLNIIRNKKTSIWLHDFIAPFYNYIHAGYSIKVDSIDNPFDTELLVLKSEIQVSVMGKARNESSSTITLSSKHIKEFTYKSPQTTIKATCVNS
jgi:hypothetical protein